MEKFRVLLASPMAEGIARIVEESFRLLPIIPPPSAGDGPNYAAANEIEMARRGRRAASREGSRSSIRGRGGFPARPIDPSDGARTEDRWLQESDFRDCISESDLSS